MSDRLQIIFALLLGLSVLAGCERPNRDVFDGGEPLYIARAQQNR